jgi:hypothetical protein
MYRKIFIPTKHNNIIPLTIPPEWYGKKIELIAFPVPPEETKKVKEEEFMKLCGAWESDKSAEEMVAEIRAARKFKEKDWDL